MQYKNLAQYNRTMRAQKGQQRKEAENQIRKDIGQARQERYDSRADERQVRRNNIQFQKDFARLQFEDSLIKKYGSNAVVKWNAIKENRSVKRELCRLPNFRLDSNSYWDPKSIEEIMEIHKEISIEAIRIDTLKTRDLYQLFNGKSYEFVVSGDRYYIHANEHSNVEEFYEDEEALYRLAEYYDYITKKLVA